MSKPLERQTKTKVFSTIGNDFIAGNRQQQATRFLFFFSLHVWGVIWRVYRGKRAKTSFLVGTLSSRNDEQMEKYYQRWLIFGDNVWKWRLDSRRKCHRRHFPRSLDSLLSRILQPWSQTPLRRSTTFTSRNQITAQVIFLRARGRVKRNINRAVRRMNLFSPNDRSYNVSLRQSRGLPNEIFNRWASRVYLNHPTEFFNKYFPKHSSTAVLRNSFEEFWDCYFLGTEVFKSLTPILASQPCWNLIIRFHERCWWNILSSENLSNRFTLAWLIFISADWNLNVSEEADLWENISRRKKKSCLLSNFRKRECFETRDVNQKRKQILTCFVQSQLT